MGILSAHISIIKKLAFLGLSFAWFAHAQPQPQMSYCLTAAYEQEMAAFKKTKKFILDENDLKAVMPLGCKNYSYQVTAKGSEGFRVITEIASETWAVDEKYDFTRLGRAGAKIGAYTPPQKPGTSGTGSASPGGPPPSGDTPHSGATTARPAGIFSMAASAGNPGGGAAGNRVPMAVLAGDSQAPLVQTAPVELPTLTSLLTPAMKVLKPEDEAKMKLEKCFSKRLFATKSCGTLFQELDKQCSKGTEKDKVSVMCLEYTRKVVEIQLDDCNGDEETWGKCELKAKQVAKLCENPLKQQSAECRALNKYLAKTPNGKPNPVGRVPAQSDGYTAGMGPIDLTSISLLKNVQSLEPSLRKILTLRPVTYELKEGRRKDVGFVAEEAEAVDPSLVSYSTSSELQGIRYPQLTTLLTSGLQELYGMCKSDIDLNKDLIRKVISLQDENAELKKQVLKQQKDLLLIKEKLGIK